MNCVKHDEPKGGGKGRGTEVAGSRRVGAQLPPAPQPPQHGRSESGAGASYSPVSLSLSLSLSDMRTQVESVAVFVPLERAGNSTLEKSNRFDSYPTLQKSNRFDFLPTCFGHLFD